MTVRISDAGSEELVVSMTSYPPRIGHAHLALESILAQELKPDRIVLCLSRKEFPGGEESLPEPLRRTLARGVELLWAEGNLRAHKKYFYAMRKYPDAVVVTVDDDKIYPPGLLAAMKKSYTQHPDCITAMHAHLMTYSDTGELLPYLNWKRACRWFVDSPNLALYAIGAGGVLYPPHLLPDSVFDEAGIRETSLAGDDIWLKAMEVANRIPVVVPAYGDRAETIAGSQEMALWIECKSQNDAMISRVFSHVSKLVGEKLEDIVRDEQRLPASVAEFQRILAEMRTLAKSQTVLRTVRKDLEGEKALHAKFSAEAYAGKAAVAKLTKELEDEKALHAKFSAEAYAGKAAVAKLTKELEGEKALHAKFSAEAYAVGKARESLRRETSALKESVADCKKKIVVLEASLRDERARAHAVLADCQKKEGELTTLKDRLSRLREDLASELFRRQRVQDELVTAMTRLAESEDRRKSLEHKYEALSSSCLGRLTLWWRSKR